jgi:hypothetical protein
MEKNASSIKIFKARRETWRFEFVFFLFFAFVHKLFCERKLSNGTEVLSCFSISPRRSSLLFSFSYAHTRGHEMSGAAAQLVAVTHTLASLESSEAAANARAASAGATALAASEDAGRFEERAREALKRRLVAETRAELAEAAAAEAEEEKKRDREKSGSGGGVRERFDESKRAARSRLLSAVGAFVSRSEDLWRSSCPLRRAEAGRGAEAEAAGCAASLEEEQGRVASARRAELEAARARVAELRERLKAINGDSGSGGGGGGDEGTLRDKLARLRAWESASFLE